jgi:hypothetical protein
MADKRKSSTNGEDVTNKFPRKPMTLEMKAKIIKVIDILWHNRVSSSYSMI